ACTLGGLPLIERVMPSLPRFRELAVLAALGAAMLPCSALSGLMSTRRSGAITSSFIRSRSVVPPAK
ncbi:hypothetical protein CS379_05475, partial [Methylobacterium frigidaeris]